MKVLLLGGTGEARALAALLHHRVELVSSLAGRVRDPALPVGEVRIGGFGGVDGLAHYLHEERIDAVVDATHPFAARMTAHAVAARRAIGLPLLIVRRPGWASEPTWQWVPTIEVAAAAVAESPVRRVFLTTGRRDLAVFAGDSTHEFLVRTVDPPAGPTPPRMTLLLARGPYTVDGETALMREHEIELLVTKNSGGTLTEAKLIAARELGVPIVVVDRPPLPPGVPIVTTAEAAAEWVSRRAAPRPGRPTAPEPHTPAGPH